MKWHMVVKGHGIMRLNEKDIQTDTFTNSGLIVSMKMTHIPTGLYVSNSGKSTARLRKQLLEELSMLVASEPYSHSTISDPGVGNFICGCGKLLKDVKFSFKPNLKWFTTDKPLPDGIYLWRRDKNQKKPSCFESYLGRLIFGSSFVEWKDYSKGQWYGPIEFPE